MSKNMCNINEDMITQAVIATMACYDVPNCTVPDDFVLNPSDVQR